MLKLTPINILVYIFVLGMVFTALTHPISAVFVFIVLTIYYHYADMDKDEYTNTDELNMYMRKDEKYSYMQSKAWKTLRKQRLDIANNQCEHCGNTSNLNLHHQTYLRLGTEHINDMRILCSSCHTRLHTIMGKDRGTNYDINILKELDSVNI